MAIIDALVEGLTETKGFETAVSTIDAWARDERGQDLVALWQRIEERAADAPVAFESAADRIEQVLAERVLVEPLLEVLARPRNNSLRHGRPEGGRIRDAASRLAHARSLDKLVSRIKGGDQSELAAIWMHELVLRGRPLEREKEIVKFHASLKEKKHPLGSMPLVLLGIEREAPSYMPMYGDDAITEAVRTLEDIPHSARTVPPPVEHAAPKTTVISDAALAERLGAAFSTWRGPNGKLEARVMRLDPVVPPLHAGRWLLTALPVESMQNANTPHVERADAESIWGSLFGAASNGASTSTGLGGAYGRHAAWTSLGALVGADADAEPREIADKAAEATFIQFGSNGPWFYDVAWDVGILTLRGDGASVAILAATDSD